MKSPCRLIWMTLLLLELAACNSMSSPPPTAIPAPVSPAAAKAAVTPAPSPRPTATPTAAPTQTPASPDVTIRLWENLPAPQARQLGQDIKTFEAQNPRITVAQQHYESPQDFMTPLMAGTLDFDLVLAPPVLLGNLWATRQLAPASDFFPPAFFDKFVAVALEGARRDNRVWALPDTAGFHLLLFYNKDLVDSPPATTADLLDLAHTLTGDGRWGLGVNSYDPLWLTPWLTPYGGWLTNAAGKPSLNTPAMEQALTLVLGWHGRAAGSPNAISPVVTYDDARAQFLQGRAAMLIDGEWALVELAQTEKVSWGVARLPDVSLGPETQPAAPLVLARYWGVSRQVSGNQAQAITDFLDFITGAERQLAWTARFGLLPTRREALDAPAIVNNPLLRVSAQQMRAGRAVPLGVNADALLTAMRDPLRQALETGLSPADAAAMMQQSSSQ